MPLSERKTSHLRRGRISVASASYFVTVCTKDRERVFSDTDIAARTAGVLHRLHGDHDAEILAATVMPDHVHLLFTLGGRLSLGQVMAKFKVLSRDQGRASWRWQDDGFEHRLRPHENTEDYAFYVFMNPYRAKLVSLVDRWQAWICPEPKRFSFLSHVGTHEPVPFEWLGRSEQIASRITVHSPF